MDKEIRESLRDYDSHYVEKFISHIHKLRNDKKASPWAIKLTPSYLIDKFKDVAHKGLALDGVNVTLTSRGVSYDYNAYKNIVRYKYPESTFDFFVVYEGDLFSYQKKDGKVEYKYQAKDPFNPEKKIIGAFGCIKNSVGEFPEVITLADIEKFKASAKTKDAWDNWLDRMVLKSVIKRICKVAFYDIVSSIDIEDNKNSDPSKASVSIELQEAVSACRSRKELGEIFLQSYKKDRAISALFKERMEEIENDPDIKLSISNNDLKKAIDNIISGELDKDEFTQRYELSDTQTDFLNQSLNK